VQRKIRVTLFARFPGDDERYLIGVFCEDRSKLEKYMRKGEMQTEIECDVCGDDDADCVLCVTCDLVLCRNCVNGHDKGHQYSE